MAIQDSFKSLFTLVTKKILPLLSHNAFAYRRMPFGLCNAPATFQQCMMAIFFDFIKDIMKVCMDDFSVCGITFDHIFNNLSKVWRRCEDMNVVLKWEKCYFMVQERVVLSHIISNTGVKVDKAKVEVIKKLQPPSSIKGIRSILTHVGFYRWFIKGFLKIA